MNKKDLGKVCFDFMAEFNSLDKNWYQLDKEEKDRGINYCRLIEDLDDTLIETTNKKEPTHTAVKTLFFIFK
jgi:hypothetical protein